MRSMETREILEKVRAGEISPEDAEVMLKSAPFVELGYAKADTHRKIRQGTAEVIYAPGRLRSRPWASRAPSPMRGPGA
nr:hypothetical protein [Candidatus Methanomethylophilus sp. 1R26]